MASANVYSAYYTKKLLVPNINGGERTSEKRKRVTRPASLSPLNPAMALGSLLSVALSSVTAKSIYMIPSVAICVNVQPRRHGCTVLSDGGVQFTPTTLFSFKRRRCSTTPLYSELVRGSVEETLNELLEQEAEKLTQAARYERNEARKGYRSGHYDRNLTTTSGDVTLHVPRLKGVSFETAIIERYRRRESSVEEALIEMYLAGVSVRRVEDITEALWGTKVSPSTINELNKKAYVHIEEWRNRPLQGGRYPYVYVDGIYLRRNWGGEYENVAVLVAIAVNEDGYREVLGDAEGMKEDKTSWVNFFKWLKSRGLDGVKLIVGDKCLGMLEAVGEVFPDAKYQRCVVHFYRNIFSVVPKSKVKFVAKMLKAIHAQESKKAAREKATLKYAHDIGDCFA